MIRFHVYILLRYIYNNLACSYEIIRRIRMLFFVDTDRENQKN